MSQMNKTAVAMLLSLALATNPLMASAASAAASTTSSNEEVAESSAEQGIPQGHAYLPKGVVLTVELMTEASSAKLHEGDHLPVRLAQNLILNDVVIVPAGSRVDTVVTKVSKASGFGHSGKLAVFTAVSILGGAFMKGKNVVIPARTQFKAEVEENTDLGVTWDELADAMDPEKPHGVEITVEHP